MIESFSDTSIAIFLLSLRFIPILSFSPPFTLLRVPVLVRVFLGLSLALWMVVSFPSLTVDKINNGPKLFSLAFTELFAGIAIALSFQWAFAAIYTVGRALDIQAGFALALLADPSNQGQMPLIGTIFVYAAAAIFFAIGGAMDLLAIFTESLFLMPLGSGNIISSPTPLIVFISAAFVIAAGLTGIVMLVLFMIDLTVAFLSRTLPQMNVLLIGFQVKTIAIFLSIPLALSFSMAAYFQLIRGALRTAAQMIPIS